MLILCILKKTAYDCIFIAHSHCTIEEYILPDVNSELVDRPGASPDKAYQLDVQQTVKQPALWQSELGHQIVEPVFSSTPITGFGVGRWIAA
ncbi:hypothetical protein Tcan_03196 [Toxocara canis]|uniref:Uncharacterized protein n=1 Tax=Toxocara canis TaxID=6265 RepID=A0A0B2W765_TOXCA|nr:hypothetical protein Tcan_03196 [Toxocara canis]